MEGVTSTQWSAMPLAERLDRCAIDIMLHGLRRPAVVYIWHFTLLLINYGCFALTLLAVGPSTHKQPLLHGFVKLIVWQHFAESLGCRQGPIYGHLGPPCNLMYRLSLGTVKLAKVAVLGTRRTAVDLLSHLLFYVGIFAFLASREYRTEALWLICGCDAFHFLSDSTQFYAANGHTYYSVLLSACFPAERGRLAGMQTALLLQWFFSGVGKIGPWFEYVNGPFMLQSMLLAPARRWLAGLLVRSPFHLSPTRFGQAVAHAAAAVERVEQGRGLAKMDASLSGLCPLLVGTWLRSRCCCPRTVRSPSGWLLSARCTPTSWRCRRRSMRLLSSHPASASARLPLR